MEQFIDFIYTGEVRESARSFESHQGLLELARHYKIKSLENFCESAATVVSVKQLTALASGGSRGIRHKDRGLDPPLALALTITFDASR